MTITTLTTLIATAFLITCVNGVTIPAAQQTQTQTQQVYHPFDDLNLQLPRFRHMQMYSTMSKAAPIHEPPQSKHYLDRDAASRIRFQASRPNIYNLNLNPHPHQHHSYQLHNAVHEGRLPFGRIPDPSFPAHLLFSNSDGLASFIEMQMLADDRNGVPVDFSLLDEIAPAREIARRKRTVNAVAKQSGISPAFLDVMDFRFRRNRDRDRDRDRDRTQVDPGTDSAPSQTTEDGKNADTGGDSNTMNQFPDQDWTYKDLNSPPEWLRPKQAQSPGLPVTKPPPIPSMPPPPPPVSSQTDNHGVADGQGTDGTPPAPTYAFPRPPPATPDRWEPWTSLYVPSPEAPDTGASSSQSQQQQ